MKGHSQRDQEIPRVFIPFGCLDTLVRPFLKAVPFGGEFRCVSKTLEMRFVRKDALHPIIRKVIINMGYKKEINKTILMATRNDIHHGVVLCDMVILRVADPFISESILRNIIMGLGIVRACPLNAYQAQEEPDHDTPSE
jgi:hypothetical protein